MKNTDFDFSTIDALENLGMLEAIIAHAKSRIEQLKPLHFVVDFINYIQKGINTVGISATKVCPSGGQSAYVSTSVYNILKLGGTASDFILVECQRGERVYITSDEARKLVIDKSDIVAE